jgi:hypothetical protein
MFDILIAIYLFQTSNAARITCKVLVDFVIFAQLSNSLLEPR